MEQKPPPQVLGVMGFDSHKPMGGTVPTIEGITEASKTLRFQAFIASKVGAEGPMNPPRTLDAVFRLCKASSWSDLMRQTQALETLFSEYRAYQ